MLKSDFVLACIVTSQCITLRQIAASETVHASFSVIGRGLLISDIIIKLYFVLYSPFACYEKHAFENIVC